MCPSTNWLYGRAIHWSGATIRVDSSSSSVKSDIDDEAVESDDVDVKSDNEEDVETNRDIQQSRQVFRGVEETRGKEYVKEELKKEGMKIFSIVSTDKNQDGRGRGASAGSRGNKLSRVNNYKRKQKESKTYGSNKADRG